MGEILGVGLTHYPPLVVPDENRAFPLAQILKDDTRIPPEMKDPSAWPEPMRIEYGDDQGVTAAKFHRARLLEGLRRLRAEIDAFDPDFLLIWGDDQYENFKEDIIPPFCILAYDSIECKPFSNNNIQQTNVWGEPPTKSFTYEGCPSIARDLVTSLINQDFDLAYAYKPLHEKGLGHSILNTLLYLDYDRVGFNYPILPFLVNCYGSKVISNHGGPSPISVGGVEPSPDPPGPSPKRCIALGAATARALKDSPWRVAIIASSSWSHAFLTAKNWWLWPDIESDRARLEEFREGNYQAWANVTTSQIEAAGQQELLNWMCLAGAMSELGRKPEIVDYIETYVLNSNKCLALFKP